MYLDLPNILQKYFLKRKTYCIDFAVFQLLNAFPSSHILGQECSRAIGVIGFNKLEIYVWGALRF